MFLKETIFAPPVARAFAVFIAKPTAVAPSATLLVSVREVAVFDVTESVTTPLANVLLPAAG
ncbi:MAG: hypothetical protein NVS3B25_09980 [Hymenobacter sp.]